MADLILYGFPYSTYVRTARMACEEKGVGYELESVELGSEEYRKIHPFNVIPAMRDGDFILYETSAICRYVDEAFDGPALAPVEAKERARMEQWISAINAYMDKAMIREIVIQRLVVPSRGGQTDEAVVAEAKPKVEHQLAVLAGALEGSDYLAGSSVSIADFFLAPMITYLGLTPEGKELLPKNPAVIEWFERMKGRDSFAATLPPQRDAAE